jgi:hypothetical protein
MNTRELVDALTSGDSIDIDNSFNSVMSQKISSALDNYRVQVAQNLFPKTEDQSLDVDTEEA